MKIENMKSAFVKRWGERGKWVYRCADNDTGACPNQRAIVQKHWKDANTFREFLEAIKQDDRLAICSQAYGEIGKLVWWPIPCSDAGRVFHAYAEGGSVLVSDAANTMGVHIGSFDDGEVTVHVMPNRGLFNENMCEFGGAIQGKVMIHPDDWDESDDYLELEPGRYGFYFSHRTNEAFFERWE